MCTNNAVLSTSTLARVHINDTVAMSSLYHVHSLRVGVPCIKNAVCRHLSTRSLCRLLICNFVQFLLYVRVVLNLVYLSIQILFHC